MTQRRLPPLSHPFTHARLFTPRTQKKSQEPLLLLLRPQEVHYATLKVFQQAKLTCTKVILPSRVFFTAFSPSLLLLLRSSDGCPRMTSPLLIALMNCPPEREWKTSILNSYGIYTVFEHSKTKTYCFV